jgi:DUF3102 family protein
MTHLNILAPSAQQTPANETDLGVIADKIRADIAAMAGADSDNLRRAFDIGARLRAAHEQVAAGTWGKWLRDNFKMTPRMARNYVQLAESRQTIEAHFAQAAKRKGKRVSAPSIRAALCYLRRHNGTTKPPTPKASPKASPKKATHIDLYAVWDSAPPEERQKFIDAIGTTALEAATPTSWRRDDIGADSRLERERLQARVEELQRENAKLRGASERLNGEGAKDAGASGPKIERTKRLLQNQNASLQAEVWRLEAALKAAIGERQNGATEPAAPDCLRRDANNKAPFHA